MTLAPLLSLGRLRSFQNTLRSSQRRYAIKPSGAEGEDARGTCFCSLPPRFFWGQVRDPVGCAFEPAAERRHNLAPDVSPGLGALTTKGLFSTKPGKTERFGFFMMSNSTYREESISAYGQGRLFAHSFLDQKLNRETS